MTSKRNASTFTTNINGIIKQFERVNDWGGIIDNLDKVNKLI
jgi:hypothetical protein